MKKRVNDWLNIIMGAVFGVFLGYGIFAYWDYSSHPGLYAFYSAPWYTGILLYGAIAAGVLLILAVIKWFLKKR